MVRVCCPGLTALVAIASLAVLSIPPPAPAQYTWNGSGAFLGGSPVEWSNFNNWQGNQIPLSGATTTINFASAPVGGSFNNFGPFNVHQLTFSTPIQLLGGPLHLMQTAGPG